MAARKKPAKKKPAAKKKLTPKRAKFVEEYLIDQNATQAAIRAGFSRKTAGQIGHDLLKKVENENVQAAIAKALDKKTLETKNSYEARVSTAQSILARSMRGAKPNFGLALKANDQLGKLGGHYAPTKIVSGDESPEERAARFKTERDRRALAESSGLEPGE